MTEDPKEEKNIAVNEPEKLHKMQALLKTKLATFPGRPFGEFAGH